MSSQSSDSNFRFWIPLDKIEKSTDKAGKTVMKVGGIASTTRKDTDGEDLDPAGFDCTYLEERGVINWNHNKSPDAVIGEPTKVSLTTAGLYVESELYPDSELANKVYDLATTLNKNSKKRRLGYSIEGKATMRDPLNPKSVKKAMITNIALTISPKNPDSIVDIIKGNFHELSDDEIIKANTNPLADFDETANGGAVKYLVDITKEDGTRILVDEDYRIRIDKSLSIDSPSGKAIARESVDGLKPVVTESDDKLTKAEVIEGILENNSVISLEKANQIYEILNTFTMESKAKKTEITSDLLSKALVTIGLNGDLSKGMGEEDDIEESVDKKKVVKKAAVVEEAPEEEESEEEEQKPKKKLEKAVVGTLQVTEGLPSIEFFKGLGVVIKGTYDLVKAQTDKLNEQTAIIEGQNEKISEIEGLLQKSLDGIDELSGATTQRKSVASAKAKPVERDFNKGITDDDDNRIEKGAENQLSISQNKNKILAALDEATFEKGFDNEMGAALTLFESSSQLSGGIIQRLKVEKGITVVA